MVRAVWNQGISSLRDRVDIFRSWIVDLPPHQHSEAVAVSHDHCDGEKGRRQEARGSKVQRYYRTIWTLLEIAGVYITRAKVETIPGIGH